MKEIEELILHERHEKIEAEKEKRVGMANAKVLQQAYFKRNEKHMRERGVMFRKQRRRFLDLLGRTGVSGGVIKSFQAIAGVLAARDATAQSATKRAVYCYINSGAPNGFWLPESASKMNLATESYADVASVCHFREIDAMVTGHARASQALGSTGYGIPSCDTIVAPILSANAPFSSFFVGSNTAGQDISSFGQPKPDPKIALNDYFSAGAGASADMTYLKAFEAQKRAIDDIKTKLSADEYDRLGEHTAAIQKIESRITRLMSDEAIDPQACAPTIPAASEYSLPGSTNPRMLEHGKLQADIIIAGLSCGLTNVGILQLGSEQGLWKTFGVNHEGGFTGDSHGSVHAGVTTAAGVPISFVECLKYISQVPAYLISQLMSTTGPDGNALFDSTVFAQVTCMGNGQNHTTPNAPFIMATRMPGFKAGFSTKNQSQNSDGSTYDFNQTIMKGLGIAGSYDSTNTLGLI